MNRPLGGAPALAGCVVAPKRPVITVDPQSRVSRKVDRLRDPRLPSATARGPCGLGEVSPSLGVIAIDYMDRVLVRNAAACRMLGVSAERGQALLQSLAEHHSVVALLDAVRNRGREISEFACVFPPSSDGESPSVDVTARPWAPALGATGIAVLLQERLSLSGGRHSLYGKYPVASTVDREELALPPVDPEAG